MNRLSNFTLALVGLLLAAFCGFAANTHDLPILWVFGGVFCLISCLYMRTIGGEQ